MNYIEIAPGLKKGAQKKNPFSQVKSFYHRGFRLSTDIFTFFPGFSSFLKLLFSAGTGTIEKNSEGDILV